MTDDLGVALPEHLEVTTLANQVAWDLRIVDALGVNGLTNEALETTSLHLTQLATMLDAHLQHRGAAARPQEEAHEDSDPSGD